MKLITLLLMTLSFSPFANTGQDFISKKVKAVSQTNIQYGSLELNKMA